MTSIGRTSLAAARLTVGQMRSEIVRVRKHDQDRYRSGQTFIHGHPLLDGGTVGNKVPHPVLMFSFIIGVIAPMGLPSLLGVSVTEQIAVPVPQEVTPDFYEDTHEYTLSGIKRRCRVRDQRNRPSPSTV